MHATGGVDAWQAPIQFRCGHTVGHEHSQKLLCIKPPPCHSKGMYVYIKYIHRSLPTTPAPYPCPYSCRALCWTQSSFSSQPIAPVLCCSPSSHTNAFILRSCPASCWARCSPLSSPSQWCEQPPVPVAHTPAHCVCCPNWVLTWGLPGVAIQSAHPRCVSLTIIFVTLVHMSLRNGCLPH